MGEYYIAVDLGTTNTEIAYGNVTRDRMKPVVLELDRKNDTGNQSRSPLLPSVVFYYRNNEGMMTADVGDYAKSRYGTRSGYVCKSVKSLMGVADRAPLVDEIPDKTPADVSAQILSYVLNGAKKRLFQKELKDVIITVPASFDSEQCRATLEAAKKAGIDVEHNTHEVLLYEPKAVIYDFIRMQNDGEIPADQLSLETEKNIMVFDLGGGTLDVTLHQVSQGENGILNIRDLAISRYTLLGGDNFDELLAADMLRRFEETNGIKVSVRRKEEVMCRLRKLAEHLKTELSMAYENAAMSGIALPDDYEFEEMDVSLYDAYAFECTYTKAEIERVIRPLLGAGYRKEDVGRIQKMKEQDVDNIIYPILDVMEKAGKDTKIDAVILNGGMTKFYPVRNRLRDFFGFEPLTTADPDLAVVRGAVYYHYCLHKYKIANAEHGLQTGSSQAAEQGKNRPAFFTGTILNDSINLGLRGEYVSLLLPAGTELPYRSEEIRDKYRLEKETDTIGIELFLGRGSTKNLPNRRIASRTVRFRKKYQAGTPISFQMYISSFRMLTMEAWITDMPHTKTVMEIDMTSLKTDKKNKKGISTTDRIRLNPKSEMNTLRQLLDGHKGREAVLGQVEVMKRAANPEDFFDVCMETARCCRQSDWMLGNMYMLAETFRHGWTDSQNMQILQMAKRHFLPEARRVNQNDTVGKAALKLIAVLDPEFLSFYTDYLVRTPEASRQIKQAMVQNVIIYEKDTAAAIAFLKVVLAAADVNSQIAEALIHRFGRNSDRKEQKKLAKLVKRFADEVNRPMENPKAKAKFAILIAELCGETGNPLCEDKYTMKYVWRAVGQWLKEGESGPWKETLADLILMIRSGVPMTKDEENEVLEYL